MPGLEGRRILVPVTRERRELAQALHSRGALVTEVECIAIAPTSTPQALADAVVDWLAGEFAWLAVTSRNAVLALAEAARSEGAVLSVPAGSKLAAVGAATTRVCRDLGLQVDLTPEQSDAAGLLEAFPAGAGRVLVPVGNLASPALARGIGAKGWQTQKVEAYRTVDGPGLDSVTTAAVSHGEIDAMVLTSTSVARRVRRDLGEARVPSGTVVVAIGDTTAASARRLGLTPTIVAASPSHAGILEALATVFEESA